MSPASRRSRLRWLLPALLVVGWLVLGGISGPFAGKLSQVTENDSSSFLPASAESTEVAELQELLSTTKAVPAVVVAERRAGVNAADIAYLKDRTKKIAGSDDVTSRVSPTIPSRDGKALQVILSVKDTAEPDAVVADMREELSDPPSGLRVYVTGPAGQAADLGETFGSIDGLLLLVAGGVVALILVIVYRSPVLPVLVLASAVFALGLASLVVYVLADTDVLALNGQSQGILFILVFGAATDYALLLVARLREELRQTPDRYTALLRAWRATLAPVGASAATVCLGVLCLLLSDLQSNRDLGPVAAIGIVASLLASTTFLPAVLALFGRVAFWPFRPKYDPDHVESDGVWHRIARSVGRRPTAFWASSIVVLVAGAVFLPQLKADGTSQSDVFLTTVDSVTGQEVLSRHYPGGSGSPTIIVAKADRGAAVVEAARSVDGVAEVSLASGPDRRPQVVDGLVMIEAVLDVPADSEDGVDTVRELRTSVHDVSGAQAKVGGPTASQLDTQETSQRDRVLIIPLVLAVVLAVLALLLRAIVAPLVLLATVVLSFAATMGVSALVFNHVFDFPGADPVVPLFGFVFLVALGVDYNIFLMTRVREEAATHGTRDGALRGLALTGGVITSAGVVLAATFAALAVIPILFLAQIAFIVAFGVLLDALLVRSLLVPALTVSIGRWIWWPSRLSRREDARSDET